MWNQPLISRFEESKYFWQPLCVPGDVVVFFDDSVNKFYDSFGEEVNELSTTVNIAEFQHSFGELWLFDVCCFDIIRGKEDEKLSCW